jgi:thioredoxin 1
MAKAVTEATYSEIVETTELPVMIDFWAEWCGPCRMIGPIVEDLTTEYDGKALILKCDVDENPEIAQKFGIRNIPTLVFLKKGELVDKLVGAVQRSKITEKLNAMI